MESRLLSVEEQIRRLKRQGGTSTSSESSAVATVPYWEVIRLGNTATITDTTFPEFDDTTRTDRAFARHATAGGELFLHDWTQKKPARATIQFNATSPFSVLMSVLTDPEVDPWWLSINGTVTAYTGSQHTTVSFQQGHNVVKVFKDFDHTNRLLIEWILFDGDTSVWVQP